ncbi:MAG TPA: RNA polymerase sigma factor [Chthoniobacterales bacterium]
MPSAESSDPAPDDWELMRRIKGEDMAAFRALVERHQHSVVGVAAKMLGDFTDAEDLAQQVFLRIWKSAGRYEPSAKFTTWLMTITRNLVFNEMRRRARNRQVPLEGEGAAREFADDPNKQPAQSAAAAELEAAIDEAITGLPEPQRIALVLRRYEEMPYEEIARVLKVSVPALKSLLFRARETLKVRLKRYLE